MTACTQQNELGSKKNPIHISLVPGQDARILEQSGIKLADFLKKEVGLHFELNVPINFIAVVEALGTKRADMAMMNTFGYLLAHEKHGARVRLIGIFNNTDQYYGQIIARADGPKKIEDLKGKSFAYVDPASTSGHLMAAKLLQEKKINPKNIIFAGRHDSVVLMVYQNRVDAGATYHALEYNNEPQDARKLIKAQHPDVFDKVKVLALTGPIPNDPVVFRKDFPLDIEEKIIAAMKKYIKTPEGAVVMEALYHMDDLRDATDDDYKEIRKTLSELGKSPVDFVK
jgi:phosphonate transport system substrate-binding protein